MILAILLLAAAVGLSQNLNFDWINSLLNPVETSSLSKDEEKLMFFLKQSGEVDLNSLPVVDAQTVATQSAVFARVVEAVTAGQPYSYQLHIPVVYRTYPMPEGFSYEIAQRIGSVNIERLSSFTQILVENYSPRNPGVNQVFGIIKSCQLSTNQYEKNNLVRALEEFETRFLELGYQVKREPVPGSNESYNLVIEKSPSAEPIFPTVIEIGAYVDSLKTTPGASQSALGAAGILEIATVLRDYPNHHPWRFLILVNNENKSNGPQIHLDQIQGTPFKTALLLDGIGWSEIEPGYMNCINDTAGLPYTIQIANLFDWVRKLYGIDINWRRCSGSPPNSVQGRYWEAGLPAVLSIGGLPYNDPQKNTCSDNMANLNIYNGYLTIQQNIGVLLTIDQDQ